MMAAAYPGDLLSSKAYLTKWEAHSYFTESIYMNTYSHNLA